MTKAEFITSIEAKPNFIKWAKAPTVVETIGEIEKWNGLAYVTTADGKNTVNVWFMVDTITGDADWQTQDTLEPEKNTLTTKQRSLEAYLKANFNAFFIGRIDFENNWAEADVYKITNGKLVKSTVLVYKDNSNVVTHVDII